jgi:hypothetical protein
MTVNGEINRIHIFKDVHVSTNCVFCFDGKRGFTIPIIRSFTTVTVIIRPEK